MENKIYCGSGKTQISQFGEFYKISVCLDDLPEEHVTTAKNGKKYVNLTINRKKETDQYGKNLSVTVDTWKPNVEKQEPSVHQQTIIDQLQSDQLPF